MSANFDLSNLALKAVCPNNEILYDDKGMPSVMVKIPKMTYADLGMGASTATHPAFIVNGTEVPFIYISKYQNIVKDGRAYSLPGQKVKHTITFDASLSACTAKGDGWHLMTRMEWGLLVRWCQNNGVMPKGNNSYGKHSSEANYKALPDNSDASHYAYRTLSGTGPLTWYHDQTPSGIADLCGNVWEWCGGMRTVYGELQILANNNGADAAHSQGASGADWKAIKASDGTLITPDGSGTTSGSVKLDWVSSKLTYSTTITTQEDTYRSATFANVVCDASISDAAKLILQSLGILQYGGSPELFSSHLNYFNNGAAERLFFSGGDYYYSSSGLASFSGFYHRSSAGGDIGFRAAFVTLPSA